QHPEQHAQSTADDEAETDAAQADRDVREQASIVQQAHRGPPRAQVRRKEERNDRGAAAVLPEQKDYRHGERVTDHADTTLLREPHVHGSKLPSQRRAFLTSSEML